MYLLSFILLKVSTFESRDYKLLIWAAADWIIQILWVLGTLILHICSFHTWRSAFIVALYVAFMCCKPFMLLSCVASGIIKILILSLKHLLIKKNNTYSVTFMLINYNPKSKSLTKAFFWGGGDVMTLLLQLRAVGSFRLI